MLISVSRHNQTSDYKEIHGHTSYRWAITYDYTTSLCDISTIYHDLKIISKSGINYDIRSLGKEIFTNTLYGG